MRLLLLLHCVPLAARQLLAFAVFDGHLLLLLLERGEAEEEWGMGKGFETLPWGSLTLYSLQCYLTICLGVLTLSSLHCYLDICIIKYMYKTEGIYFDNGSALIQFLPDTTK